MTEAPARLTLIASRVQQRIDEVLVAELGRWRTVDPDLAAPLDALRRLVLAGGKRLRPAFCHWAFVGAGGDPDAARVVDAGAALELLHTFALIHDDIMDGSITRRGLDATHVLFQDLHAAGQWHGEARRFGEGVGILVGDLAFVYADLFLRDAPGDALDVFTELRLEVNIGQYLDLLGTVRRDASVDAARRICIYKSGRYTTERPLHLGAALAGRLNELQDPLTAFGAPLGEAFQLRDDLLGVFGDTAVTGKPVGEDLREGKPTALYALAAAEADGAAAELLARRFGSPDLAEDEITQLQEVLVATGAKDKVEARIGELLDQSLLALARTPITDEARTELEALAVYVAGRDH
ncbi:MAG: geranylgeranyl diphosphate synthase, type [Acidimicrobiaceae bacterium]|nr:geranylgeranyl diphosphate synthase, type [Acidimicrobiaceae bacterium]